MAHLVIIVPLLAAATVATGLALPLAERNQRPPRDEAHDGVSSHDGVVSELAANRSR